MRKNMRATMGQAMINRICLDLTNKIPFESARRQYESSRQFRVKDLCLQYFEGTMNQIHDINGLNFESPLLMNESEEEFPIVRKVGRRLSIMKRKIFSRQQHQKRRKSFKYYQPSSTKKGTQKTIGLIKLQKLEEEEDDYQKFVETLRKKKEKFSLAIQQFDKREIFSKASKKNTLKFVTNYEGKKLKLERKQKNPQKNRIKPNIHLKQPTYLTVSEKKTKYQDDDELFRMKCDRVERISCSSNRQKFKSIINIVDEKHSVEKMKKNRLR